MLDTHVYEVLPGEVLFRRSGNGSRTFITCKVVRTRAIAQLVTDRWMVGVDLLATGYENLWFDQWFDDWDPFRDNLGNDLHGGMQSGRSIEAAVEATMLDRIIQTGQHHRQQIRSLEQERFRPFGVPLVAVRIRQHWVEPGAPVSQAQMSPSI